MLDRKCFNECVRKRLGWLTWIFGGGAAAMGFFGALILGGVVLWVAFVIAIAIFGIIIALALLTCYFNCK